MKLKKTNLKIFSFLAAFSLLTGSVFISCNNTGTEEETERTAEDIQLENTAYTVLSALCNLSEFDPDAATNSDGEVEGIETLPKDWKNISFACSEGFVLGENKTVRTVPVLNAEDAKAYFADIIGYTGVVHEKQYWSEAGFGNLDFTLVSEKGVNDLYAVIDVDIPFIPELTQIRLVDMNAIESSEEASKNVYGGKAYYAAGDVIKRISDGSIWMCVRPSGGPLKKDKSIFICLDNGIKTVPKAKKPKALADDATDAQKTKYNQELKKYNAYKAFLENRARFYYEEKVQQVTESVSGERTAKDFYYSKRLMSLKTAKAAFHTFTSLLSYQNAGLLAFDGAQAQYERLKAKNYDIINLGANTKSVTQQFDPATEAIRFNFAYGKPVIDPARSSFHADVLYVQPFLYGSLSEKTDKGTNLEDLRVHIDGKLINSLYSVTDDYDYKYIRTIIKDDTLGDHATEGYDYLMHLHGVTADNGLCFNDYRYGWLRDSKVASNHVILSPELEIRDNKGTVGTSKKPSSLYEDIVVAGNNPTFDYWASLTKVSRLMDGVLTTDLSADES